MATELKLLCAGAAQGLVKALQHEFEVATGAIVTGRFGAVGAMKEALLAGTACDLMVVTDAMIAELVAAGHLQAGSRTPLGRVRTGIAVRTGEPLPDVSGEAALRSLLLAAQGLYFPDPVRSTAGIHFVGVLGKLGIHDQLEPRFRTYPNGATAMRELAASQEPRLVGCTQVSEIKYTEGVSLVGPLPEAFELATVYSAAIAASAQQLELAVRFIERLAGEANVRLRRDAGFEPLEGTHLSP